MSTGVIVSGAILAAVWLGGRWLARYETRAPRVDVAPEDSQPGPPRLGE